MPKNVIYPSEPCSFSVTYKSNPLTPYNKDFSDILDVIMSFKLEATEADDKYLIKYLKDGTGTGLESGDVIVNETDYSFTVVKQETDELPVNSDGFNIFVGVLVTGLSKYIWLRVDKGNEIIVENDGINDWPSQ